MAGTHLAASSSRPILPSSTSIITPIDVTGLVIDAMRKIESLAIGTFLPTSCLPNASW